METDGRKSPKMLAARAQTVRRKGEAAARAGWDRDENPYRGWQGGYRRLWFEGFDAAKGTAAPAVDGPAAGPA